MRPLAPGDIVAAFSEHLDEWTAAQITDLDPESQSAGVLDLDWSGPEPASVADLGQVEALRTTHHNWNGQLSHRNCDGVLPRGFKVIGSLPLLHDQRSSSYGGWPTGLHLFLQRRWDQGHRDAWSDPRALDCAGDELDRLLAASSAPDREIRRLAVRGIAALDAGKLVAHFPDLTSLTLVGNLGTLSHASSLNDLSSLKRLFIKDLFGMDAADVLLPDRVPALESLDLVSVPAGYAKTMRATWQPEVAMGTALSVTLPRKPEWVAENQDNPFRDWDGDDRIPRAAFKKAVAQYKQTQDEVVAVLAAAAVSQDQDQAAAKLFDIGARYSELFNRLDERYGFIDTVERENLFDVLAGIVAGLEAGSGAGAALSWARDSLIEGADSVRDW